MHGVFVSLAFVTHFNFFPAWQSKFNKKNKVKLFEATEAESCTLNEKRIFFSHDLSSIST